jgi:glycosyltransferase involved in cell wall biosynthesis
MISIIVVNLNSHIGLENTLKSIQSQTNSAFELFIIDGGSTDSSLFVIEKYLNIIKYWHSQRDNGIYDAMNIGLSKVKSEHVMFLNSGDCFCRNDAVDIISNSLKKDSEFDVYFCDIQYLHNNKTVISDYPTIIDLLYLLGHSLCHQGVIYRTKLFNQIGNYSLEYRISSDWAHMFDALVKYRKSFKKISEVLINYDTSGISSKNDGIQLLWQERKIHLKKHYPWVVSDTSDIDLFSSKRYIYLKEISKRSWSRRFLTLFMLFLLKIKPA